MSENRDDQTVASATRQENRTYQVFLAASGGQTFQGLLGRVARLFGLDVYGPSLLSRRARIEIQFASLLLLIIFFFDFGAWSLLFNAIFHSTGDLLARDGLTVLAVFSALLVALAILVYERQFLSADLSGNRFWSFIAVSLRMGILAGAAYMTAQPVELIIFRGPIERRMHQEGLRAELVDRKDEIDEKLEDKMALTEQRKSADTTVDQSSKGDLVRDRRSGRQAVENEIGRLESRRSSANNSYLEANRKARELKGLPPESQADLSSTEASADRYKREVEDLDKRIREKREQLRTAEGDLEEAISERDDARDTIVTETVTQESNVDAEIRELRQYIDKVRKARPGETVYQWGTSQETNKKAGVEGYEYRPPEYDFFERLRVLEDLRAAEDARWPAGVRHDQMKKLSEDYGIDYVAPEDVEGKRRLARDAALFEKSYKAAFGIALVIPLLILAVKFLMTPEVKAYYSSEHQAYAGNPEALALRRAQDEIRARRRKLWTFLRQRTEAVAD